MWVNVAQYPLSDNLMSLISQFHFNLWTDQCVQLDTQRLAISSCANVL